MNVSFHFSFRFHYDSNINVDEEMKLQLYKTLERMYSGVEPRLKHDAKMEKFNNAVDMDVITRDKKQPGIHSSYIKSSMFLALI